MPEPAGFPRRDLFCGALAAGLMVGALPAVAEADSGPRLRNRMTSDAEWARFLAGQDLIWQRLPRTWYEGPFLSNGFLGTQVYREPGANALRFTVDHGEVQDHRPQFGNEWGVARLAVGRVLLTPVGQITGVDLRLDLWNAELRGTVTTDKGGLAVRAFVHAASSLLSLEVRPGAGECEFQLSFKPAEALSPRTIREPPPKDFPLNPPPVTHTEGDVTFVVQPMVAGGQTATAYRIRRHELFLSVAHSFPGTEEEGVGPLQGGWRKHRSEGTA